LNVGLIAWIGWYGAAVATLVSSLVTLGLAAWQLNALINGVSFPTTEVGYQMVASAVMLLVVSGLKSVVPETLAATFGLVGVGAVVYGIVLLSLSDRVRAKGVAVIPT
jgi:hypothetical protein